MKRVLVVAAALAVRLVAAGSDAMPAARQNALIATYCTVCHTDAFSNGGLSLEHFDAARPDPNTAAMIVSKLHAKALGASGTPLPDRATQDALLSALEAEAAGAGAWEANTRGSAVTANLVRETPAADAAQKEPDLYRITITCDAASHQASMQLAWSPGVPAQGREMSASVDGMAPVSYRIEGFEKMGNGQNARSGPGAIVLRGAGLPRKTLTVGNVFPGKSVVFPFDDLPATARAACSGGNGH